MPKISIQIRYLNSSFVLGMALLLFFTIGTQADAQCGSCPTSDSCLADAGEPPEINADPCRYPGNGGCPDTYSGIGGGCCQTNRSPIIIDLTGDGFHLSDAADGVWFRPYPKIPAQYKVAWPEEGAQNGWLVLDRNGNGLIDDFGELFGDQTPQPAPPSGKQRNGFLALAVYDTLEQGGNGDGWISKEDRIFGKLRIWVDTNHDGISQPNELYTLDQVGIVALSLNYHLSKRIDANGNVFRYRSVIRDDKGGEASRIIYDVFLELGPSRSAVSNSSAGVNRDWFLPGIDLGFPPKSKLPTAREQNGLFPNLRRTTKLGCPVLFVVPSQEGKGDLFATFSTSTP